MQKGKDFKFYEPIIKIHALKFLVQEKFISNKSNIFQASFYITELYFLWTCSVNRKTVVSCSLKKILAKDIVILSLMDISRVNDKFLEACSQGVTQASCN